MKQKIRIAILASGSGSNAESIVKYFENSSIVEIGCIASNKKKAYVLQRAGRLGIPFFYLTKKRDQTSEEFDQQLSIELKKYKIDWIVLAGYMKVLTASFLKSFDFKVINIHPSLLPKFPGAHAYRDFFYSTELQTGCTVHLVDEGVDTGKIIEQFVFTRKTNESLDQLIARGLQYENTFYPKVLEKYFLSLERE